jgi:hypothetical protein
MWIFAAEVCGNRLGAAILCLLHPLKVPVTLLDIPLSQIELYTDLVFLVGIRLVFLGIYQTNTGGKLGRYILYYFFGRNPFFP